MSNILGYLCSSNLIYEINSINTLIGRNNTCDIV